MQGRQQHVEAHITRSQGLQEVHKRGSRGQRRPCSNHSHVRHPSVPRTRIHLTHPCPYIATLAAQVSLERTHNTLATVSSMQQRKHMKTQVRRP